MAALQRFGGARTPSLSPKLQPQHAVSSLQRKSSQAHFSRKFSAAFDEGDVEGLMACGFSERIVRQALQRKFGDFTLALDECLRLQEAEEPKVAQLVALGFGDAKANIALEKAKVRCHIGQERCEHTPTHTRFDFSCVRTFFNSSSFVVAVACTEGDLWWCGRCTWAKSGGAVFMHP